MQCNAVRIIVFACTLIRFCSSSSYWSNPTIYTLVDSFPFKNKHQRAFVQPDWSRKTSKEGFPPLPQSRLPAISGGNPNQPCHPPLWSTELVQMFFFQISLRSSLLSGFPSPHSLWCEEKKKTSQVFYGCHNYSSGTILIKVLQSARLRFLWPGWECNIVNLGPLKQH